MLTRLFSDNQFKALEKALDGSALRQKIITNNIANVDTPNYKSMEVTFEDELKQALAKGTGTPYKLTVTNPRHLQLGGGNLSPDDVQAEIHEIKDYELRNDKNNVDIDREMAKLSKNELYYDAVTRNLNDELRLLRMAITEGRK
ncbi:MAG: flagellar basal body rod protein FlgB [Solirubrobacterales bacterium]